VDNTPRRLVARAEPSVSPRRRDKSYAKFQCIFGFLSQFFPLFPLFLCCVSGVPCVIISQFNQKSEIGSFFCWFLYSCPISTCKSSHSPSIRLASTISHPRRTRAPKSVVALLDLGGSSWTSGLEERWIKGC
jgi:hypothetical protein